MPASTAARERLWPCVAPLLVLAPWLGKAFHIDDAQFLIYARLIAERPWNPYAQVFEWDSMRVAIIDFPHPLLWQYALAGLRAVFGESELALHALTFACGGLALVALRGLALRLDVPPLPACALLAGSSAFAVMGSTIMPDLAATALGLSGLERAIDAVERGRARGALATGLGAGLLVGAAFLTRFTAVFGVAWLLAYPLLRRRRDWRAWAPAAVAVAVVLGSEIASAALAGRPHFWSSLSRWSSDAGPARALRFAFDLSVFLGAQLPLTGLVWFALVSRGRAAAGAVGLAGLTAFGVAFGLAPDGERMWAAALFAWPGLALVFDAALRLAAAARERFRAADPAVALRWVLAASLVATPFATVRYEHVAVKYVLMPLPAAILLLLDALGGRSGLARRRVAAYLWASCAVGIATGAAAAWSDYRFANTYRDFVASELSDRPAPAGARYHNAQWGLRYYAERAGWAPWSGQPLAPGDELLLADGVPPNWDAPLRGEIAQRWELAWPGPFALMSVERRAGFYSNYWGFYPFVPARSVRDTAAIVRAPTAAPPPRTTRSPRAGRAAPSADGAPAQSAGGRHR